MGRCLWLLQAARAAQVAALAGDFDLVQLRCALVQLLLLRFDRAALSEGQRRGILQELHGIMLDVETILAAQRQDILAQLEGVACAMEYHEASEPPSRPASRAGFLV
jgi:hypothetical protein